jgi:glutamyl-tRNA reductase
VIVVVGVSHREAPIAVRERLAVDKDSVAALLRSLVDGGGVREALCVSTCNRTEVYAVAQSGSEGDVSSAARRIVDALERLAEQNGAGGIVPYLVTQSGKNAVRQLFRVAASLDSLVIGEPQILGQVKDAFEIAKDAGTLGHYLGRAMSRALHVAKRVRTETEIGAGQVSVASVAVDLARQIFGDLGGRAALLLGAGEMAEGAAKLLVKCGAKLAVVNRSADRGAELARQFGGTARPWDQLPLALAQADVVVASTAAKHFVVTRELAAQAIKARKGKSLFFIDIAVPRDVDPAVNKLNNAYLYDIDNLSNIVAQSMEGRRKEADRAEALVGHEADAFESWAESRNVTGTIVALREKVRASLDTELERTLSGRLKHLSDADRQALGRMMEAAVNKLLHTPVSRIKAMAADPRGGELVQTVHELFDLPEVPRETAEVEPVSAKDPGETKTMNETKTSHSRPPPARETLGR